MSANEGLRRPVQLRLRDKLIGLNWGLVLLIMAVVTIGLLVLYSAAGGRTDTWVMRQAMRFALGFSVMLLIALVDIRFWFRNAYAIYGVALALLVVVELVGHVGMGAQRWISLGFVNFQPSELMKIALVLALARYLHGRSAEEMGRVIWVLPALALVLAPVMLVMRQPDLGTAILIALGSLAVLFAAGVRIWKFLVAGAAVAGVLPFVWGHLHDYQKARVLTFFDPERDPLGAGYHIIQSKIALGSGGLLGKGYLLGTQSQLNFLPEKQTDFIFTVFAEEFGLLGGLVLVSIYVLILAYGTIISLRAGSIFGRLVAAGVTSVFFIYVFINVAMVMGLLPVVGVPLPLVSYGGTSMVSILAGFGLLMNANIHREVRLPRRPGIADS